MKASLASIGPGVVLQVSAKDMRKQATSRRDKRATSKRHA